MLNALDHRNDNPFDRSAAQERPELGDLLDWMAAVGEPEAAALALVMAHLADDELVRARTLRAVGARSFLLPRWLHELSQLEVMAAEQITDPLRDSHNVIVQARLGGHVLTAVTLVDFNLGTIVKDNFFTDQPLESFNALWREQDAEAHSGIEPLSAADARARLADAVEIGARTWPAVDTEDWPRTRPLLEWVLRQMPSGGVGFGRAEWSEQDQKRLVDRFLASPYAADLDRLDDPSIAGDLVWYRTDYGFGDPLRWSVTAAEILMLDWYPRKIVADQDYLARMPTVLRRFIQFGHAEAGLDENLTTETLQAVDAFEPDYRDAVSRPRRQGPEALLERMGVLDPLAHDDDLVDEDDLKAFMRGMLAELVGGEQQLDTLTTDPLPDEPFDEHGVPADVHDRVAATLALCDDCCTELLDTEHRTAVRRLLHDAAVRDPQSFGGRAKPRTAAAALCWLVGRANESVGYGGLQTQELMGWFGLKSPPVARANSIRRALGLDRLTWPGALGSARYLTAARRTALVTSRDQELGVY